MERKKEVIRQFRGVQIWLYQNLNVNKRYTVVVIDFPSAVVCVCISNLFFLYTPVSRVPQGRTREPTLQ